MWNYKRRGSNIAYGMRISTSAVLVLYCKSLEYDTVNGMNEVQMSTIDL
jgi:hypothetical protein